MLEHIANVLKQFQGNREQTAKALGISVRGLRNHLLELRRLGYETFDREVEPNSEGLFPSNEQRVKHLDWQGTTTGDVRKPHRKGKK